VSKYVLGLVIVLTTATAFGQKKSIVNLISSKSSMGMKLNGKDLIKVYDGTFKQDYSTLTSDSAYFYPQDNACDAFGHVVINQGDTLHIYSDKLNYNGNTKIALLTDNVRMVDKDATLTTNYLTYNTATRIGTYTDGGKLVNKDNTLLSKNGYYFAFTRDAYFRYNVSLTTPDALVKTDTMRYNTGTKIAYFYGPTHIYSTKGDKGKDKDTLYTENGFYNTAVEQAAFGKNNLYQSGSKSLKGDSLFYDKIKGYGRAVKHVTFSDREQKITIKGDLGTYFKADERAIVTQDPYIIMVTEEKDTTKTGAKADSVKDKAPVTSTNGINMAQLIKKTIPGKTDTLNAIKNRVGKITTVADLSKKLTQGKIDTLNEIKNRAAKVINMADLIRKTIPVKTDTPTEIKRIVTKADSVLKKNAALHPALKPAVTQIKKIIKDTKAKTPVKVDDKNIPLAKMPAIKDTSKMKHDSIYMSADTIETRIITYKDLKIYLEKERLSHIRDTTAKARKANIKESKFLTAVRAGVQLDTSFYHADFFGKPKPVAVKRKPAKPLTKKQLMIDSLIKKQVADSIAMAKKMEPADTARIRIIMTYHHAKLFKSDLQAKGDSMFYSSADSTLRCFVNPIIWTQGSQLSGDTIYLQMKHKKLDNMAMFPSAFIVNIDKDDSAHFNQVAGKRMRGYFKDDKLNRMDIFGNAESIYYSRDSAKSTISGMERSLSSRIRVDFKDNNATNLAFYTKPQHTYGPLSKFKDDERILKGFIWKPKERPVSKESIIPSYNKKKPAIKSPAEKPKGSKPPFLKPRGGKAVKDSINMTPVTPPGIKAGKDSVMKPGADKLPLMKIRKDSLQNRVKSGKDTSAVKPAMVTPSAAKE
jgi:lipopolysaccharide export system protein LptA/archaellum component FlaC